MKKLYATDKQTNEESVIKKGTQKELELFKKQCESIPPALNKYKNYRISN